MTRTFTCVVQFIPDITKYDTIWFIWRNLLPELHLHYPAATRRNFQHTCHIHTMRFCALWLLPRNSTVFGATTPRNSSKVATGPHAATIFWVKHSTVFFLLASWDLKPGINSIIIFYNSITAFSSPAGIWNPDPYQQR